MISLHLNLPSFSLEPVDQKVQNLLGSGQEQLLAHRLKVYVQILIQESLLLSSILHYKFK